MSFIVLIRTPRTSRLLPFMEQDPESEAEFILEFDTEERAERSARGNKAACAWGYQIVEVESPRK